jgi:hypothetical protein
VIGDLSGQHDPSYTPLNGSAHDKDALRDTIKAQWGEIKHPTVDQLVLMVLTLGQYRAMEKRLKRSFQASQLQP